MRCGFLNLIPVSMYQINSISKLVHTIFFSSENGINANK